MIALLIANSLALASLLIMLASGLALIYGLRDVINFGHGAIYMLGAYLGYTVSLVGGFWLALIVVPILLAILGIAFEYLALRPLQHRSHIEVALVTLGLGIVLGQIIIYFYGGVARLRSRRRTARDLGRSDVRRLGDGRPERWMARRNAGANARSGNR